jgi:hypothetical protein
MCEFEALKELYCILKVENNPKNHWTDWSGWRMAEAMHDIVRTFIRTTMQGANFFSMSANEVIIVDNQQWISVHVYIMEDWHWFSILLTF